MDKKVTYFIYMLTSNVKYPSVLGCITQMRCILTHYTNYFTCLFKSHFTTLCVVTSILTYHVIL